MCISTRVNALVDSPVLPTVTTSVVGQPIAQAEHLMLDYRYGYGTRAIDDQYTYNFYRPKRNTLYPAATITNSALTTGTLNWPASGAD